MKNLMCIVLVLITALPLSVAEEKIYPLDIKMRVHPQEIHYGDACFFTFSVTNKGQETLFLPHGRMFLRNLPFSYPHSEKQIGLYHGEKRFNLYYDAYDTFENNPNRRVIIHPPFPGYPVKPGQTMEFHIRLIWFPLPEFAHREQAQELLKLVTQGEKDYKISFPFSYCMAYRQTARHRFDENNRPVSRRDFPANELSANELEAKGYKLTVDENFNVRTIDEPECCIRILPRPPEDIKLLHEWYLELPTVSTAPNNHWTREHVFAHPHHVNGSPYKIEASTPEELSKKREPFYEAYGEFFVLMETRTPESLERIKRTNELATQILERAKEPNSTISQNVVEFIQLRGFLVDMRYVENPEAEKAAFEKLMDFVENAKDKTLWVRFLDEIGFWSINHRTHFPFEKVEQYRKLFGERFPEANVLPQYVQ